MRFYTSLVTIWCLVAVSVYSDDSNDINRINSPVDESSCICGLNKEILERLEAILRYSVSTNYCAKPSTQTGRPDSNLKPDFEQKWPDKEVSSGKGPERPKDDKGSGNSNEDKAPQVSSTSSNDENLDGYPSNFRPSHESEHQNERPSSASNLEVSWPSKSDGGQQKLNKTSADSEEPKKPTSSSSINLPFGITVPTSAQDFLNQLQGLQGQIAELVKPQVSGSSQSSSQQIGAPSASGVQTGGSTQEEQLADSAHQIQLLQQQQLLLQQLYQQQMQQLQQQQISIQSTNHQQVKPSESQNANLISSLLPQISAGASGSLNLAMNQQHQTSNQNNDNSHTYNQKPTSTGFLDGLPQSVTGSDNEALMKLNQSTQVKPEDMAQAVQSTVPNVVSNIFSNIHDLAIQTEKIPSVQSNSGSSYSLTSIDGSSVNVAGNTVDQITANGEKLFMQWVEHQLSSLKLTVSAANYIRKNAINLFRRIVRQYIRMVEKLGGSVEDNVRRATQMALSNTEKLTSFLLRNYLNFAGGLMQIIGDQVSRVGKQLDTTGGTIATMSLNPFDIISNVIDSLPNPSDYSRYFREFGKYLISGITPQPPNELQNSSSPGGLSTASGGSSNDGDQQAESQTSRPTIFSKTMGALGKTFGWIG